MKNAMELVAAVEESALFIDASLADNGKPDPMDLFNSMPMIKATKEAILDSLLIHEEIHAASEDERRKFSGDLMEANLHLCKSVCALIEAVKPG